MTIKTIVNPSTTKNLITITIMIEEAIRETTTTIIIENGIRLKDKGKYIECRSKILSSSQLAKIRPSIMNKIHKTP